VQRYASALNVARSRSRQIPTQTRRPKHTASSAIKNARTVRKGTHASAAVSKSLHRPPPENLSASSYDLAFNVPHPENDLSSTRPAPLSLPDGPVQESDGSISLKSRGTYLFRLGKAFVGFYKIGIKNIWYNYKEYRQIRKRIGGTAIHTLIKYEPTPKISRREFQLYLRTQHDLKKLLPFCLVFAICGEFTPLVIPVLGTAVVPHTCRIPKQVKQNLQKTLSRIQNVERMGPQQGGVSVTPALAYVHGLDPFGLALRETPVLGPLLWRFWVEPNFNRCMDDIICDAILIMREGGAQRLEPEELYQFCVKIRKFDTIKHLIDHYTLGTQSQFPDLELKRTQEELQVFLDEIRRQTNYEGKRRIEKPELIFESAARHANHTDGEVYVPKPEALKGK
jgi:LETM1-like protein